MLDKLYHRTMRLAGHRHATWALAIIAFAESSFFPIPPDVLLIPMVLAARQRAWLLAGICLVASIAGGIAGYAIGYFLFETIGAPVVAFYGYEEPFARFQASYNEWGAWIVAFFGLTPFPYKVITIASGVTQLNPATFLIASLVSRGIRFFVVAGLLYLYGPSIRAFIEKRLGILTVLFFVLLFAGFAALKYL